MDIREPASPPEPQRDDRANGDKSPRGVTKTYRTAEEVDTFVAQVIEAVKEGKSVKSVCRGANISFASVWTRLASPKFAQAYQEAFALRAQSWVEDLIDISDDSANDIVTDDKGNAKGNMAAVARSRLGFDARRWVLSKLFPRQYGDALAVTGADGGPLQISWSDKPMLDITPDSSNTSGS